MGDADRLPPVLDARVATRNFRAGNYDKISRAVSEQVSPWSVLALSSLPGCVVLHHALSQAASACAAGGAAT